MKKKKFQRKLSIKKQTIANLGNVRGGNNVDSFLSGCPDCDDTNYCTNTCGCTDTCNCTIDCTGACVTRQWKCPTMGMEPECLSREFC
jgi:hypothetical protein